MFCRQCGKEIEDTSEFCVYCGAKTTGETVENNNTVQFSNTEIQKDWLITLLLSIFLGSLGVHRFYVGKIGTGILMLVTCGGCGIWTIIDIILIVTNNFSDSNGKIIKGR